MLFSNKVSIHFFNELGAYCLCTLCSWKFVCTAGSQIISVGVYTFSGKFTHTHAHIVYILLRNTLIRGAYSLKTPMRNEAAHIYFLMLEFLSFTSRKTTSSCKSVLVLESQFIKQPE